MIHNFSQLTAEDVRAYCAADPSFISQRDELDYTPLIAACGAGHTEMVRVLLEAGADPNLVADDGETPLKAAIPLPGASFNRPLFDLLLAAGANPNTGLTPPLCIAVARRLHELVTYLVQHGADPNIADVDGATPLFWAVGFGGDRDVTMVRLLIHLGADASRRDIFGRTVEDWIGPAAMREALRPYDE